MIAVPIDPQVVPAALQLEVLAEDWALLFSESEPLELAASERLIRAGHRGEALYLIVEGEAQITAPRCAPLPREARASLGGS